MITASKLDGMVPTYVRKVLHVSFYFWLLSTLLVSNTESDSEGHSGSKARHITCESDCDFVCESGETISVDQVCDGVRDCTDGEDEFCGEIAFQPACTAEDFMCDSLTCISWLQVCDGKPDCLLGQDERADACHALNQSIPYTPSVADEIICNENHFMCDPFFCVPREMVCDGKNDCINNADEVDCQHVTTTKIAPMATMTTEKITVLSQIDRVVGLACNRFRVYESGRKIVVTCPPNMRWKRNTTWCVSDNQRSCESSEYYGDDKARLSCPRNLNSLQFPDLSEYLKREYFKLSRKFGYPIDAKFVMLSADGKNSKTINRNDITSCVASHKCVYSPKSGKLKHSEVVVCPRKTVYNDDWNWCSDDNGINKGYGSTVRGGTKQHECNARVIGPH